MTDLSGHSLGRYHLLEPLGEGGMAVVYKAYDTRLEREVAVKVIRVDQFGQAVIEGILKRFEREAKSLARLTHPNIVKVHDFGEHEGVPYLVMEYLPGGTLKERMRLPISWQAAARLLLPVLSALEYAHEHKIIHRDIKPANILLTEKGHPMLTDFGIAKILETEAGQTLTGTGIGIGTPEYMAPEQGLGKQVDGRADLYSLGIVFYELVTGRKPYTADTPMAVVFKHISDPLSDPRQFAPDLPEGVARILFKSLAKAPADRYPDAQAFAAALEKLLENQSASAPEKTGPTAAAVDSQSTLDGLEAIAPDIPTQNPVPPPAIPESRTPTPAPPPRIPISNSQSANFPTTQLLKYWPFAAGLLIFSLLAGFLGWLGTSGAAGLFPTSTPTPTSTATLTLTSITSQTPASTAAPRPTETLVFTVTPYPTSTPVFTATPALGIGSTLTREKDGMVMVYVPAGAFSMGSDDEESVHSVTLDAFWIDRTEVTNSMYALCVQAEACQLPMQTWSFTRSDYFSNSQYADYPVIYMDWSRAKAYCEWVGGHLPSEAEWEKTARGTDGRTYPWGNDIGKTYANYNRNASDTTRVGSYESGKSPYGAYDLAGNVWEWVNDWYGGTYYRSSPFRNPSGPSSGSFRVIRGGAWIYFENGIRSADRYAENPSKSSFNIGFRCAHSPSPTSQAPSPTLTSAAITPTPEIGSMQTGKDGMTLLYVPAGKFTMGSDIGSDNEKPAHTVTLDAFWIDQTEVTNAMYALCVKAGVCNQPRSPEFYANSQYASHPVVYVSRKNAETYCSWAERRLPSEAEWEKAARGTDERTYPWGNDAPTCNLANYSDCRKKAAPVGSYLAGTSPYGALDMAGNVSEWIADWYDGKYYQNSPSNNPTGPDSGDHPMLRGGSWASDYGFLRSFNRETSDLSRSYVDYGFRCARGTAP